MNESLEKMSDEKTPQQMDPGQLIVLVVKRMHELEQRVLELEMANLNTSKSLKTIGHIAYFLAGASFLDLAVTLFRAYMVSR